MKATLIFSECKGWPLLNRIFKDGFAHVRVVIHQRDVNILVDPCLGYTNLQAYAGSDILVEAPGETHVKVSRMIEGGKLRRVFGPLNCVEVVKGFIGISSPLTLTPYQLYKEVTKNG